MKAKIIIVFLSLTALHAYSQEVIRFTGVVLDREKFEPAIGVTIFNQTRGGGAVTDSLGFFSVKAEQGDTLLFSDVRFINSTFVIPEVLDKADYGIIQLMIRKSVMLEEVKVYSFPSEDQFKEAFMSIDPKPNLETRAIEATKSLMSTVRDSYENDKHYYEVWADRRIYDLTGEIPTNHFLDPFRWTEFITNFKDELEGER